MSLYDMQVIPFAEVEPFYDFREDRITLTLLTIGVKVPINKTVSLKVGQFNVFLNEKGKRIKGPMLGLHINL